MPVLSLDSAVHHAVPSRPLHAAARLNAIVLGTPSPALLFGLESLVHATEGLRLAASASSLEAFLDACDQTGPCVALADPALGGRSIAEFMDAMAARNLRTRSVLLAEADRPLWVSEALRRGVFGFVSQSADLPQIRAALLSAAAGRRYIPAEVAAQLAESLTLETLTTRESQVLDLLSQGQCNKTIARDLDVAVGTVKTHVRSILHKLGSRSRMGAILEANRRGLISIADPTERGARPASTDRAAPRPTELHGPAHRIGRRDSHDSTSSACA